MRWDIFCQVIDNHGDLGVCWRLARQLAADGECVRLWVDDSRALAWMAPGGTGPVALIPWGDGRAEARALADPAPDVLVEAFGCDPAPALVAHFAAAARAEAGHGAGSPRAWINLEYLSAEAVVQRLHGLPSPQFSGPGAGLTKHFFYPGFAPGSGGLLREPELPQRQAAFERAGWLAAQGVPWRGEPVLSLFCYEPPGLAALLEQLARAPTRTLLLITPGRAAEAVRAHLGTGPADRPTTHGQLLLHWLAPLSQPDYDHLLWACDFNFVRGEDSLVRALWAGVPLGWHIYPQHDDAHHPKLEAWLDWLQAPASLRAFQRAWNGMGADPLHWPDAPTLRQWRQCVAAARGRLDAQADLLTQLRLFIDQKS